MASPLTPAPTTGTAVSAVVTFSPTSTAAGVGQLKYALGASDAPGAGLNYLALPSTPMNAANQPRVFQLTLSKSATTYSSSVSLAGVVLDVLGNVQSPATTINAVWKAYSQSTAVNAVASPFCFNLAVPAMDYRGSGEPIFLGNPSGTNKLTCVVNAAHVGRSIVEIQFPSFANTEGTSSGSGDPLDMIYVQVQVIVVP